MLHSNGSVFFADRQFPRLDRRRNFQAVIFRSTSVADDAFRCEREDEGVDDDGGGENPHGGKDVIERKQDDAYGGGGDHECQPQFLWEILAEKEFTAAASEASNDSTRFVRCILPL